jgi:molybdenum-dependent DNA-binding transcriptional regulator ModE
MEILPEVRLVVDGVHISFRQLEALRAVAETGSQNRASKKLGIAVPVLHRYVRELEAKLGYELLSATPRGTVLTKEGGTIIDAQKRFENRLKEAGNPVVACSPLFFPLVSEAVAAAEKSGYKIDIMLGDDRLNTYYLNIGVVGLVVFDDPISAYREKESYESFELVEVVKDTLLHVRKGRNYLRYSYGAQRIGFNHLDLKDEDYTIKGETRDIRELMGSEYSFFINRSYVLREGLRIKSAIDPGLLMHSIFALRVGEGEGLDVLLNRLGRTQEVK